MAIKFVTFAEQILICLSLHTRVIFLFLVNVNSNRREQFCRRREREKLALNFSKNTLLGGAHRLVVLEGVRSHGWRVLVSRMQMGEYGVHETIATTQMLFVVTMISTVHSCKECGMVQSITTIRAKISPKKSALDRKSMLWPPAMGGTVSVLFYILFESSGCLGIHCCPGTPWHWCRHKVYVKHDLLIMCKLEFIVKSWSCLWARNGQNDFMTLRTSFSVCLRFCALLSVDGWWLFTTYFSDVTSITTH